MVFLSTILLSSFLFSINSATVSFKKLTVSRRLYPILVIIITLLISLSNPTDKFDIIPFTAEFTVEKLTIKLSNPEASAEGERFFTNLNLRLGVSYHCPIEIILFSGLSYPFLNVSKDSVL